MSAEAASKRALRLQERICTATCPMPNSAVDLYEQLERCLLGAIRAERLRLGAHQVKDMLKLTKEAPLRDGGTAHAIVGGQKDFTRTSNIGQLPRDDGGLFNFSITVRHPRGKTPQLAAYDFELRMPPGTVPAWVRFDLNLPEHHNTDEGIRCHVHPGNDDLLAHAPLMTPVELLELFVYKLRLPAKPRHE